jgi:diaminopropionate ammonia-lyase
VSRILVNPGTPQSVRMASPGRAPLALHRRLPGYAPTPLRLAPHLAGRAGVRTVLVKDESSRFGLPAFKVLGAWWAVYRILVERLGREPEDWSTVEDLRRQVRGVLPRALVAATDGNHGRGVAHVARRLGIQARILVPQGTAAARVQGIASEGASVVVVDGTYDQTVERAAAEAGSDTLLVQDASWPGYEQIPRWIEEGYSTLFWELEEQLTGQPDLPELVLVQIGVGALAAAAVRHFRREGFELPVRLLGVEPISAACVLESAAAGRVVRIPVGPQASVMVGLTCGTPSATAWPDLRVGLDAFLAIEDGAAKEAMRLLAADGIVSGETGAAGAGGLLALCADPVASPARDRLGVHAGISALVLSTEGATDREAYAEIVRGSSSSGVPRAPQHRSES